MKGEVVGQLRGIETGGRLRRGLSLLPGRSCGRIMASCYRIL
jgi:hypothetical protein